MFPHSPGKRMQKRVSDEFPRAKMHGPLSRTADTKRCSATPRIWIGCDDVSLFEMKTKQAKWYDNGFVFPNIENLQKNKYDVVYCQAPARISKNYMTNMKQYVENAGS